MRLADYIQIHSGGQGSGRHAEYGDMREHLLKHGFIHPGSDEDHTDVWQKGPESSCHIIKVDKPSAAWKHYFPTDGVGFNKVRRGAGLDDLNDHLQKTFK